MTILDDARSSLLTSTREWYRDQWSGNILDAARIAVDGIGAILWICAALLASIPPVCLFFGWWRRRESRRECERHGTEWRA